jgi:hypothetical protein
MNPPVPRPTGAPSDTLRRSLGLTEAQAVGALWAARGIAEADGLFPGERTLQLLELAAETLECSLAPPMLTRAMPDDLGIAFPGASERRALVDALILVVCIEGEVRPARRAALADLAARLGVRSPFVEMLDAFATRSLFAIKRGLGARSPDAQRLFARIWAEEGLLGVARAIAFVLGLHRDESLAARFVALAELPPGTFGRAVADHFAARGLAYPGQRGGMPERMIHHDLMHVLNGYDTDAAGECELAGFYCGFTLGVAREPFTFVMTVLATFHLGLRVSPAVVIPARGAFDPRRVLAAFLRGRRLTVDVMGNWDYWALMPSSLEEAKRRLGIEARDTPTSEARPVVAAEASGAEAVPQLPIAIDTRTEGVWP